MAARVPSPLQVAIDEVRAVLLVAAVGLALVGAALWMLRAAARYVRSRAARWWPRLFAANIVERHQLQALPTYGRAHLAGRWTTAAARTGVAQRCAPPGVACWVTGRVDCLGDHP